MGLPTAGAITLNKIAPALLDAYLGRTGYRSQQTGQPADPCRPDNLWEPLPGDHGAHGSFDARALPVSRQLWASTHRGWLLAGAAALAGVALAVTRH